MSRYEQRAVGVFDREELRDVFPGSAGWGAYLAWCGEGNVPDLMPVAVESLGQRRQEKRARIAALRSERERVQVVTLGGDQFAATPACVARIALRAAATSLGAQYPPGGTTWLTADRRVVTLDAQQLRQLAGAVLNRLDAIAVREGELYAAIAAAPDPDSIDIEAGWPDPVAQPGPLP